MGHPFSRRAFLTRTGVGLSGFTLLGVGALSLPGFAPLASAAPLDAYDTLRQIWLNFLTGGSSYNTQDPNIAAQLTLLNQNTQTYWSSLNTAPGRTYLWSDLATTTKSSDISNSYGRLYEMALAYTASGSQYQGNASLLSDTISALDWMYANRYTPTAKEYDNWYDWVIGTPQSLNNSMVLLYNQLSSTQIANYCASIDHFAPDPNKLIMTKVTTTSTGANRSDACQVVIIRGIVGKNASKIAQGQQALSDVTGGGVNSLFINVTSGDGFYTDGSFIQHTTIAYTGSYGIVLLNDLANLLALLTGSSWAVTDPNVANVYQWIYNSFEPLMYQGAMMDMVRGRAMSRYSSQDHNAGHSTISAIMQLAQSAASADAANFKSMVKSWIENDTFLSYYSTVGIPQIVAAEAIVNDSTIQQRPTLVAHIQYPNMYRVVHRRPTFGFGISMFNGHIANYESLNKENLQGWYTGYGMTYLYNNNDLGQYSNDFWATVNPYRLAGTTVDTQTRTNASGANYVNTSNWRQGASLPNTTLGLTGLNLFGWNSTLKAKKSWFCLDDMIVALGAGISESSGYAVESIVENRRLSDTNSETLIVNGTTEPTTLGWSSTMSGVNWINLSNTGGYYFPGGAALNLLREARTGSWNNVNQDFYTTNQVTHNYATVWYEHGTNPTNATYAYVLFPGQSPSATAAYAASPTLQVLHNTIDIQAIQDTSSGIWAGNFWAAGTADVVTSNTISLTIIFQQQGNTLTLAVSDPTLKQTQLSVTINIAGYNSVVQADSHISVTNLGSSISFTVDCSSQQIANYTATFSQ